MKIENEIMINIIGITIGYIGLFSNNQKYIILGFLILSCTTTIKKGQIKKI